MGKKRKTYYLNEETILRVKEIAHEQKISENDAFEKAVDFYDKLTYRKNEYFILPNDCKLLLLEAVDNLIYQTRKIMENTFLDEQTQQTVHESLKFRLQRLQEVRASLMDNTKKTS